MCADIPLPLVAKRVQAGHRGPALRKPYFASEALVEQFQGTPGRYHLGDGHRDG